MSEKHESAVEMNETLLKAETTWKQIQKPVIGAVTAHV